MANASIQLEEGDIALRDMLLGHGYIMNGGLEHFLDLEEEEQKSSIDGYRYYGFNEMAEILVQSKGMDDETLELHSHTIIDCDDRMVAVFRDKATDHQELFAPIK